VSAHFPALVPVRSAVDTGLAGADVLGLGYESVAVAEGQTAPELAIAAGRAAVAAGAVPSGDIDVVMHCAAWYQGLDLWTPASYIAASTVGDHAVGYEIGQLCNGGMGAFHLAAACLDAGSASAVLITTGDVFAPPVLDRWSLQDNMIVGDAGTAAVLSTRGGFARVLATAVGADNSLEPWLRGTAGFGAAPGWQETIRLRERGAQHAATGAALDAWERYENALVSTHDRALAAAGVKTGEIARVVAPFVHRGGGQTENHDVLGYDEARSAWELGRTVGHLGAGDQIAGLDFLWRQGHVGPGDVVALVGSGPGFNFAVAVIEIIDAV
jgi:3-oxoacyl-[acyl-carrier-protein] synthase-3